MDLLNLGEKSRKTGLKPRANLAKDKYDMEDVDEFFEDTTWAESKVLSFPTKHTDFLSRNNGETPKIPDSSSSTKPDPLTKNSARRYLGVGRIRSDSKLPELTPKLHPKKPLPKKKSPTPEYSLPEYLDFDDVNNVNQEDEEMDEEQAVDDDMRDDMTFSPIPILSLNSTTVSKTAPNPSPVSQLNSPSKSIRQEKAIAGFTKTMALKPKRKVHRILDDDDDEEVENDALGSILPSSDDGDTFDSDFQDSQRRSQSNFATQSTYGTQSNFGSSQPIQSSDYIIRPSPLPSPPPEGLRRSKRTKIAPLAYWRNERIVYSRANGASNADPDSTLVRDIRKIPLQEIKEVVHIPETEQKQIPKKGKRSKNGLPRSVGRPRKQKQRSEIYDYESDPEIEGSEWYKDKSLQTDVFENEESTVRRVVAWAPDGGNFQLPPPNKNGQQVLENFKVAPLFDADSDVIAAGLLEFPVEGFKSLRTAGESLFMFHVAKGLIEVTLNSDKFVVTRGCSFEIPKLNIYSFKNIGQDSAKLFFVQCQLGSIEDE